MAESNSEPGSEGRATTAPAALPEGAGLRTAILVTTMLALLLGWFSARGPIFQAILASIHLPEAPSWTWPVLPALGVVVLRLIAGPRYRARALLCGWLVAWFAGRLVVGAAMEIERAVPRLLFANLPDFQWRHLWAFMSVALAVGSLGLAAWAQRREDLLEWFRTPLWEHQEVVAGVVERSLAVPVASALRAGLAFAGSSGLAILAAVAAGPGGKPEADPGRWVATLGVAGALGGVLSGVARGCASTVGVAAGFGLGLGAVGLACRGTVVSTEPPSAAATLASGLSFGVVAALAAVLAGLGRRAAIAGGLGFFLAAGMAVWVLGPLHGIPGYTRVWLMTVATCAVGGTILGLVAGLERDRADRAAELPPELWGQAPGGPAPEGGPGEALR